MTNIVLRAFMIWLLIAVAEVLHGILRVRLLNRRVGDHRARQIAVFTGSGIILVIAWFSVPWLGASSTGQLLGVGCFWLALMLAFEIAFGRFVLRASWQRLATDFDFRKGGLLSKVYTDSGTRGSAMFVQLFPLGFIDVSTLQPSNVSRQPSLYR